MFFTLQHIRLWLPIVLLTLLFVSIAAGLSRRRRGWPALACVIGAGISALVGSVPIYLLHGNPAGAWMLLLLPLYFIDAAVVAGGTAFLLWLVLRLVRRRRG